MQIGMIGLGKMGSDMSRRLMRAGHQSVVLDANTKPREASAKDGATAVRSLEDVVEGLGEKPRAVWLMLPAGQITEETVERLGVLLEPNDIIIDGGNFFYRDDIRRTKKLTDKRIRYVVCGTSGVVWGIDRGYGMMIAGPKQAVDRFPHRPFSRKGYGPEHHDLPLRQMGCSNQSGTATRLITCRSPWRWA
jgi:6-phosphogluconate dehydrogenase